MNEENGFQVASELDNTLMIQILIASIIVIASIIWFAFQQDFEPLIAILSSVLTLAGIFQKHKIVKWLVIGGGTIGILGLVFLGIRSQFSDTQTSLTVRVADINGRGIERANVLMIIDGEPTTKLTDNDGIASFLSDNQQSEAKIIITHPDYKVAEETFSLGDSQLQTIVLQDVDGSVHTVVFRVLNADNGRFVRGAQVVLISKGVTLEGTTDDNSLIEFNLDFPTDVIDVDITVTVEGEDFTKTITLRQNSVQDIQVSPSSRNVEIQPLINSGGPIEDGNARGDTNAGELIQGSILSEAEEDLITFEGKVGDLVTIRVTPSTKGFCPAIDLRDPGRETIASKRSFTNCRIAEIEQELLVNGEYTVIVRSDSFQLGTGDYELFIQIDN